MEEDLKYETVYSAITAFQGDLGLSTCWSKRKLSFPRLLSMPEYISNNVTGILRLLQTQLLRLKLHNPPRTLPQ